MSKCIGCGIQLQNTDKDEIGYVDNLDKSICERCFRLKNYGEYKGVSLTNVDYQNIIQGIPAESLVVYVVDMMYLNVDNILKFPNTLLVLTKRDLLPKSIRDEKIIGKIKEKRADFLDIICVSSVKNYQMDRFYNSVVKYADKKEIYFVGNTNSGKSTLLNQFIHNYDENGGKGNITVSMYPSTTLDKVEINLGDLKIIDTPGLIEKGSYVNILDASDMKKVTPKKEIKPRSCQVNGRGSILIGEYVRIDYNTDRDNSFVIYVSNNIKSGFISLKNDVLKEREPVKYFVSKKDLVIPGIGFVKFTKGIEIEVYVRDEVTVYLRDNLI